MSKYIIIASESSTLYTTKRLIHEGTKLKQSTIWINPYEESSIIPKMYNKGGLYIVRTTGIRYDDFDLTSAKNYSLANFKITNSLPSLDIFRSKEMQSLFFKEHGLTYIPSIMYRGSLQNSTWKALLELSPSHEFILKMSRGNQGIGVNLIKGKESLQSFLETFQAMKDQRFLIQPFVRHKKELRLFIIKNEIYAIVERTISNDDFRGNAKRSSGKLIKKLPTFILDEVYRAFKSSKLDYCGMDIIWDGDNFIFLEINAVPGFEQVESLSKFNIAREILLKTIPNYSK